MYLEKDDPCAWRSKLFWNKGHVTFSIGFLPRKWNYRWKRHRFLFKDCWGILNDFRNVLYLPWFGTIEYNFHLTVESQFGTRKRKITDNYIILQFSSKKKVESSLVNEITFAYDLIGLIIYPAGRCRTILLVPTNGTRLDFTKAPL